MEKGKTVIFKVKGIICYKVLNAMEKSRATVQILTRIIIFQGEVGESILSM